MNDHDYAVIQRIARKAAQGVVISAPPITIDKTDLACLTEACRDCADAITAGNKDRALSFTNEIRAMADYWRTQLEK